ncbi:hypothetical protein EIK76_05310 [Rheinheimera mesophila]|uniref:Uncharacterized protein n=1 Tax=Rheinheimera mesophila TaxID=1547515 RepID=A0A3P3QQN0_9GAMM|nr:hypothetical protein [Rheinheimera mesophila]KKL03200.1 hypothetical protein SD53_00050 [Rheinheimera mesophila]RRJ23487.1 hypothetical protein EIK76_05310 [Rheinheimera mesophila]
MIEITVQDLHREGTFDHIRDQLSRLDPFSRIEQGQRCNTLWIETLLSLDKLIQLIQDCGVTPLAWVGRR